MSLLESTDIQLLTQLGFMAAGRADTAHSQRIFNALALLRPQHAFAHIGTACAWMNAGKANQAVQYLSRVRLPAGDEADMIDAFHALALQLAGHTHQSTQLLEQLVQRTHAHTESRACRMALCMLGQLPKAHCASHSLQGRL